MTSRERALYARVSPRRGQPPLELAAALAAVRERYGVAFDAARARAGFSRGHLLDVVLELPGGRGSETELAAADDLVSDLLGEARHADWIGEVSLLPAPHEGPLRLVQPRSDASPFFPLGELGAAVDAAIAGLYAGLPAEPLWAQGGEQRWFLFELDVEPADDYPAQADVTLVATFMPEMLKCYLSGSSFASLRFFRTRELFAYLKYVSVERDPRRALAKRRVLEDALDAALVSERSGRVVGSGLGVVYSYVDLVLDDVERGLDVVREVGRRIGLGERARVEFADEALDGVSVAC